MKTKCTFCHSDMNEREPYHNKEVSFEICDTCLRIMFAIEHNKFEMARTEDIDEYEKIRTDTIVLKRTLRLRMKP